MLTDEQKELFQKDKYELVDIIIDLRNKLKNNHSEMPGDAIIKRALNKLNKESDYGNKKENKTYREESSRC